MGIVWVLKSIGAPGSASFLLASMTAGLFVTFLWPRNRALGRAWMLVLAGGYLLLSLPNVAGAIADRLPTVKTSTTPHPIDALVVLDGDNWQGRLREAGTVFAARSPRAVWLLGDPGLVAPAQDAGIPRARIRLDSNASNTREQMTRVRELLRTGELGRTAVLASRVQMPRVAGLARALGLDVALIASPVDDTMPALGARRFVPGWAALCLSRDALYEHAALAYYRRRGWIATES